MSLSKPVTLARLSDVILGSFSFMPQSDTLDHLLRYLGTWSGSDKLFMIIQYAVKIIVPLLNLRGRLQHRAGLRKNPTSQVALACSKLGSIVGDSRMLWRIWGLLPIIQWLISLERNPPATRKILTIERLQGWSMLAYYPLEHLYYLVSHNILPSTIPSIRSIFSSTSKPIVLDPNTLGLWSSRFWALYVVLQFAHLREDRKLIRQRERNLRKAKGTGLTPSERLELQQRWGAYRNEVLVNLGYLPLTVHWSLEKGLFKNEVWVGILGLVAAITSFKSGWEATALPAETLASQTEELESFSVDSPATSAGFEMLSD